MNLSILRIEIQKGENMIGIQEKIMKRCFFEKKDGSKGVVFHKSVILSEGSIIRYDRKNQEWKFEGVMWDSKISPSLMRGSLSKSIEDGRERKIVEKYSSFEKFSNRMIGILGIDHFMEVVLFLK